MTAKEWPRFHVKREPREGNQVDQIWFHCAACGEFSIVDEKTGLCRDCWRPAVLTANGGR